jgi:hypothetical protein
VYLGLGVGLDGDENGTERINSLTGERNRENKQLNRRLTA